MTHYINFCALININIYVWSTASVTIFQPSSFYIIVQTKVGIQLQIQLTPTMQLYIHADPSYKSQVCGE